MDQLKKEHELTKQMTATLSSFRVDPSLAAAANDRRYRKREDESVKRDPDIWPPPTPQEPRLDIGRAYKFVATRIASGKIIDYFKSSCFVFLYDFLKYCMAQKFYMGFNFTVLWLLAEP